MSETFLHGVEVVEIDNGIRPIRTVRSSVIGLIGTAPNAAPAVKASAATGSVSANTGLTWQAKTAGAAGNDLSVIYKDPGAASQALSVTFDDNLVTVNLATDSSGVVTTTATALKTAALAVTAIAAAFDITLTGSNTGAGVVSPLFRQLQLTGGENEAFPLDTPVLIAGNQTEAAKLGSTGTLPGAVADIFDQTGAVIVVVRVAEGVSESATITNVIGGVDVSTGQYKGVQAFLSAGTELGVTPRILCAKGFTHQRTGGNANPVVAEMIGVADKLKAIVVADGPGTTDAAAITYRGDWGSKRVFVVDPHVKVFKNGVTTVEPGSAHVAGVISRVDNDEGFWHSPSNHTINGIVGTGRAVDFALGDANCRANLLNEQEVATVIRYDGFRLWGNRTTSADPKWAFLSVVRTADMINESILKAHLWAVDRNITKTYVEEVVAGVNAYIARLKAQGALIGGECWADKDLNTPANIADGKVFFTFKFTPPFPAEHVTFRSMLVNDYLEEIL